MLRLENLKITQGSFQLSADWAAKPGEIIALIGPSGGGKSSLLLALAGFLNLASGRVFWNDRDLSALAPALRPVSILFQDQNLFPHLTIQQNLALALSSSLRTTAEQSRRIDDVLARLGLQGLGNRRPADLSGGQQGRAALGRVLLQARPVLLLDEPFAALGPALKTDLLTLVRELVAETKALVLLVTHDPSDAVRFARRSVLVADGIAHPPLETAALMADPPEALRTYLGDQR